MNHEGLKSKKQAFLGTLNYALNHMMDEDYIDAAIMFRACLRDLQDETLLNIVGFSEIKLYSIRICLAYAILFDDLRNNEALLLLSLPPKNVDIPITHFLRAYFHLANGQIVDAEKEYKCAQHLFKINYRFQPNEILNSHTVPEVDNEFLLWKLSHLRMHCEFAKSMNQKNFEKFLKNLKPLGKHFKGTSLVIPLPNVLNPTSTRRADSCVQASPSTKNAYVQTKKQKDSQGEILEVCKQIKNSFDSQLNKVNNDIRRLESKNAELRDHIRTLEEGNRLNELQVANEKKRCEGLERQLAQKESKCILLEQLLTMQIQQAYEVQDYMFNHIEDNYRYKVNYYSDLRQLANDSTPLKAAECDKEIQKNMHFLIKIVNDRTSIKNYNEQLNQTILNNNYENKVELFGKKQTLRIPSNNNEFIYKVLRNEMMKAGQTTDLLQVVEPSVSFENNENPGPSTSSVPPTPIPRTPKKQSKQKIKSNCTEVSDTQRDEASAGPSKVFLTPNDVFHKLSHEFQFLDEEFLINAMIEVSQMNGGTLNNIKIEKLADYIRPIKKKLDEVETCVICFEQYNGNRRVLDCSHHFHIDCIDNWLKCQKSCPICRVDPTPKNEAPKKARNSQRLQ